MGSQTSGLLSPVRRERSQRYVLVLILCFALTVAITRLFLYLAGYPQLGGGELHIAHCLWGGLLLILACLALLVWSNLWIYPLSAVLAGAGVGLFIDEVGKFITKSVDYFFAPAAAIIYVFFLMMVAFYLGVRKRERGDVRSEMFAALEEMQEVVSRDLDPEERESLTSRLRWVKEQKSDPAMQRLAGSLLEYVEWDSAACVPARMLWAQRVGKGWRRFCDDHLTERMLKRCLGVSLTLIGIGMLSLYLIFQIMPDKQGWDFAKAVFGKGFGAGADLSRTWVAARIVLTGIEGAWLLAAGLLILRGRAVMGAKLAYFGLLFALGVVDVFVFYTDQFITIPKAFFEYLLLLGVMDYRRKVAPKKTQAAPGAPPILP